MSDADVFESSRENASFIHFYRDEKVNFLVKLNFVGFSNLNRCNTRVDIIRASLKASFTNVWRNLELLRKKKKKIVKLQLIAGLLRFLAGKKSNSFLFFSIVSFPLKKSVSC